MTYKSLFCMRTAEQARLAIELQGLSVSAWAREKGFRPAAVQLVLKGKAQGRYGITHKIMVALEMKPKGFSEADLVRLTAHADGA